MLILINQFDLIHQSNIYNDTYNSLPVDGTFYILDTDDMEVESISYNDLYSYIKSGIINVENICFDSITDALYCSGLSYTFMDFLNGGFQTKDGNFMFIQDKINKRNGVVVVRGKKFELKVGACNKFGKKYKNSILLNGNHICSVVTNDGLLFNYDSYSNQGDSSLISLVSDSLYGIPYIAKLSNVYLIHFYMYSLGSGYELLLVVNESGDIVDVFPLNGFEKYFCDFKFIPKSEIFRTKYKVIFKERY